MQQNAQQVRSKLLTLIMAAVAGLGFATAATAAKTGGSINARTGANNGVMAPVNAQAGDTADAHMSPSGSANSNSRWQSGATPGADRAAERMNANGEDEMRQSAGRP